MGWNGTGTYTREQDWAAEAAAGNPISSTKFDIENDSFAAGINACIAKNGENAATNDLPMGSNKHTGVADGTASNHYAAVGQVQGGSLIWGGTSGGTANAQTITLSPAPTAYTTGMRIAFMPGNENTASVTLNVNGLGAKTIKQQGQNALGGALRTDAPAMVIYDGTDLELISDGNRMFCDVYDLTSAQSIGATTTAEVQFASETSDPWDMHDTVTNNQRITVPQGMWMITGTVSLLAAPSAASLLTIHSSGSTSYHLSEFSGTHVNVSGLVYRASGGGYFTLSLENNGAGSITISSARFCVARVG
jgi:hypothetical protein